MKGRRAKDGKGRELVLLKDLVPKRDPMGGGSAKPVFGEGSALPHTDVPGPVRKVYNKKK